MKHYDAATGVPCNDQGVPYKTATELGIYQWEHDALIIVMQDFRSGALKDEDFNMRSTCGTAKCIGGWVGAMRYGSDREAQDSYVSRKTLIDTGIARLYYPGIYEPGQQLEHPAWDYDTIQASNRIEKYLLTGQPD